MGKPARPYLALATTGTTACSSWYVAGGASSVIILLRNAALEKRALLFFATKSAAARASPVAPFSSLGMGSPRAFRRFVSRRSAKDPCTINAESVSWS